MTLNNPTKLACGVIAVLLLMTGFRFWKQRPVTLETDPFVNGEPGFKPQRIPPPTGYIATIGNGSTDAVFVTSNQRLIISCDVNTGNASRVATIMASILRKHEDDWIGTGTNWAGMTSKSGQAEISIDLPASLSDDHRDEPHALVVYDYAGHEIGRRLLELR